MRLAFLMNGLTGYLDGQHRALHKLGNELLIVTPGSPAASGEAMADTAFTGLGTEDYAQVVTWVEPPDPKTLVRTVLDFEPDAVFMTSWNYTPAYRAQVSDPWELHVVGIGPLDTRLAELPGVTMHGFVQPAGVAELMRESSALVLTSHIEPYGVVLHEAAAAGLPLLSSEFGGAAPVFVQDGHNGWLVPSGDVRGWAQAMARMSALPPERLATMSEVSRAVARRMSPTGWALHIHEEIERRIAAGGGRLTARGTRRLAPVNRRRAIMSTPAPDRSQGER
jgi:hypothetical protein